MGMNAGDAKIARLKYYFRFLDLHMLQSLSLRDSFVNDFRAKRPDSAKRGPSKAKRSRDQIGRQVLPQIRDRDKGGGQKGHCKP